MIVRVMLLFSRLLWFPDPDHDYLHQIKSNMEYQRDEGCAILQNILYVPNPTSNASICYSRLCAPNACATSTPELLPEYVLPFARGDMESSFPAGVSFILLPRVARN